MLIRFCLIICLVAGVIPAALAEPTGKTVLLLFPYQHDLPMHAIGVRAIREEFAAAGDMTLDVYDEYLDRNRYSDSEYQKQLFDFYRMKYRSKQVDLVIVQTEEMLDLWLEHRAGIAPDAPVVFFDTLTSDMAVRKLPPGVTGVSGTVDLTRSVEWLLHARASIDEIVLVQGAGPLEKEKDNRLPVEAFIREMGKKVRITDLSGYSLPEIKRRVAALPKTSAVLSNIMFEDAAGVRYRPIDSLRELASASAVPVISGFDHVIGTGTIGGYMYSVESQAHEGARIGLRILRGEAASSIAPSSDRSGCFMFDHIALQRFGIPLSALPPGSIIKNRQYTFWELYRPEMIATISGIAALVFLVIILLGVARRLSLARRALAHLNVNLETQIHERTLSLRETNTRLRDEIDERKQSQVELALSTADRLEQQTKLLAVEEERKVQTRQQRFARDLHDGLGAISANIGLLAERGARETQPENKDALFERISRLTMENGMEVRSLIDSLETGAIGWGEVIENCRRRAALAFDPIWVRWEVTESGAIPDAGLPALTGLSLLRLVREATNNILKHAHAQTVRIYLAFDPQRCSITIQDDGCGFGLDSARPGRGLKNMRQRIEELGGTMHIKTDSGVRLVFEVPLPVRLVADSQPPAEKAGDKEASECV